jgi:beta-glucanase (GH16 family)
MLVWASFAHAAPEWRLVWQESFPVSGQPSPKLWRAAEGGGGWGNEEQQTYVGGNASVAERQMTIEARRVGNGYTSARIHSRESWTYGRFVIRARLPAGRGTWPAIWMMPADPKWNNGDWPDNGEIDIMEHVGFDYGAIHGSLHMKTYNWMNGNQPTAIVRLPDVDTTFHDYGIEWSAESLTFFIDDQRYLTYRNPHQTRGEWPFDQPFYVILNVAVGGSWGGEKGIDDAAFPQRMVIDSVKVYQDSNSPKGAPPKPVPEPEPVLRGAGACPACTLRPSRGGRP